MQTQGVNTCALESLIFVQCWSVPFLSKIWPIKMSLYLFKLELQVSLYLLIKVGVYCCYISSSLLLLLLFHLFIFWLFFFGPGQCCPLLDQLISAKKKKTQVTYASWVYRVYSVRKIGLCWWQFLFNCVQNPGVHVKTEVYFGLKKNWMFIK